MDKKEEVVVCSNCGGTGVIYERVNAYESEDVICKRCNGKGRLVKVTTIDFRKVN